MEILFKTRKLQKRIEFGSRAGTRVREGKRQNDHSAHASRTSCVKERVNPSLLVFCRLSGLLRHRKHVHNPTHLYSCSALR